MTKNLLLLAAALVIFATAISIAPVAAQPAVTLIEPATGTQGEERNTSITGTSLGEIESISLYGDDPSLPISEGILFPVSDTLMACAFPLALDAPLGTCDVVITTASGLVTLTDGFTITTNLPPIASFTATPSTGPAPLTVYFDAAASYDPEDRLYSWVWDFGDGPTGAPFTTGYIFETPGTRMVTLTVTDFGGLTATATQAIEVTATYGMDAPGTTVTGSEVVIDTAEAVAAGTVVQVSGDDIVLTGNGLVTTITTGGVTVTGGTVTGEIREVSVQSEPLPGDFATAGEVQASFTVDLTGLVEGSSVSATLTETPPDDATTAFGLAATDAGMVIGEVAYAMEVTHTIPTTSINGATIEMTASADWVAAQGGVDAVHIIRYSEGVATILPTTGEDIGGGMFRFTALSPRFSIFGLAGLEPLQNQPPSITSVTVPLNPVQQRATVPVSAVVTDADVGDTLTATWDWGDGATSEVASPAGTVTERTIGGSHIYEGVGVYTVSVTVTDGTASAGKEATEYVVVYDPNGGFVTGGGWIASPTGAYLGDTSLTGKATFGIVSKYQKGATAPTGQTQFEFQTAGFSFHSTAYQWLVIAGAKAQYKGSGTVNGAGDYSFLLTAVDGQVTGGGGSDTFRLKVQDKASGTVVYDNQLDAADSEDPTTPIGGGSIVVHKK